VQSDADLIYLFRALIPPSSITCYLKRRAEKNLLRRFTLLKTP